MQQTCIVCLEEVLGFMQNQIKEESKEWAKGFLQAIVAALAEKGSPVAAIVSSPTGNSPLVSLIKKNWMIFLHL